MKFVLGDGLGGAKWGWHYYPEGSKVLQEVREKWISIKYVIFEDRQEEDDIGVEVAGPGEM